MRRISGRCQRGIRYALWAIGDATTMEILEYCHPWPAVQEPSASCVPRGQEDYCVACQTLAHGDRTHRNCRARRARREKGASSGMRTSADASVHAHGPSLITTHASVIDLVLSMEKVSVRSTLA